MLKRSQRGEAGRQCQLVVGFLFIDPRTCGGEGSLSRIVFIHERFKVDESLRPRAPIANRYEDDSRTVAAVVCLRRIVVKRVSLVAVVVAQDVPRSKQERISPERHRLPKLQMHVLSHLPIDGAPNP